MKLTGKTKDNFEKWFFEYYNKDKTSVAMFNHETMFKSLQELIQNAYIIDFFDSVGINILLTCEFDFGYEILDKRYEVIEQVKKWYETRQEATNQAIITANKLYNETN